MGDNPESPTGEKTKTRKPLTQHGPFPARVGTAVGRTISGHSSPRTVAHRATNPVIAETETTNDDEPTPQKPPAEGHHTWNHNQ